MSFHFSPRPNRAHEIHWREWSETTFEEAKRQDKPILLGISAVWCHWCHVMDETSYSDPANIELINREFIPVRVDNDRRPDINRRYNMGGWPTTALLAPTGEVLTGGTYIPPDQLHDLLAKVSKLYKENREDVYTKIEEIRAKQKEYAHRQRPDVKLHQGIIDDVLDAIAETYDPEFGGFGTQPKFPHTDALSLLVLQYYRTGLEKWGEMLRTTLKQMRHGGMYDQEAGGFFRYSTTRDWSIPHYEKMLEDNANLLRVYLQAFQVTGEEDYKDTALHMLGFIDNTLSDREHGVFFGSQDADEEYYKLSRAEREKRTAPYVDRTIYTDWNAMMFSAYLHAYHILGERRYFETVLKGIDFLWERCYRQGEGMYHYYDGQPQLLGVLTDQVHMANALLDAYETTGNKQYLEKTEQLARVMLKKFYDRDGGGFFDDLPDPHAFLQGREKSLGTNGIAAAVLLRLHVLTENDDYRETAVDTLRAFAHLYQRYGVFAANYASAVDMLLQDPVRIAVVGKPGTETMQRLLGEIFKFFIPHRMVRIFDTDKDQEAIARAGYAPALVPRAYLCIGQTCSAPLEKPEELRETLRGCNLH